jgi:ribonuclease HI
LRNIRFRPRRERRFEVSAYLVLAPESIRGIYDTWPECKTKIHGVSGAVYRKTRNREEADSLLRGEGRRLAPGTYAFVDGNHDGGIGVVLVHRRPDGRTAEKDISTTVAEAAPALARHLARSRNVLAEIAAVLVAVRALKIGTRVTIAHDYNGVSEFIQSRWRAQDPGVVAAVSAVRTAAADRGIALSFVRVDGHQSAVGGDEFAAYNGRADRLAREAARRANIAEQTLDE